MKIEIDMRMPQMPNYIKAENIDLTIDVGEMSDEEIKTFIIKWQDAFLTHAKQRKDNLKKIINNI